MHLTIEVQSPHTSNEPTQRMQPLSAQRQPNGVLPRTLQEWRQATAVLGYQVCPVNVTLASLVAAATDAPAPRAAQGAA